MTALGGHLSDIRILASGLLADIAVVSNAGTHPDSAAQLFSSPVSSMIGSGNQMLFLHARYHQDPRMPLLQHHLNALDYRGAVHALRVETQPALTDAIIVMRALLRRAGRILVVQDGLDLPRAHFSVTGPASYLLLATVDIPQAIRPLT